MSTLGFVILGIVIVVQTLDAITGIVIHNEKNAVLLVRMPTIVIIILFVIIEIYIKIPKILRAR